MYKKILIANRGEIAVRVIRACRELDIATVAVYSVADEDCLHTKLADEAICIGPAPSAGSYLNIPNIISAAEVSGADAIHPGYGFLAENYKFAEICRSCDLDFIGPQAEAIKSLGDKAFAKETMSNIGIPVIPGSEGVVTDEKKALAIANEIGYPVIIKAAAGGGGRGMRIVQNHHEVVPMLRTARTEAEAAFGNPDVYLEKYIEEPRHIEMQILADKHGEAVYLGERDCSIQRRHQKLIEESPSTFVGPQLRRELGEVAVKAVKSVGYENAGTIEFLVDSDRNYYFMEMNTRIQVEHTVTETVTGIDLIKEQIRLAAGEVLDLAQSDININGHAIEFRINAEDPNNNFLPAGGKVTLYNPPGGPGVRVDSHLYSGYIVPNYYDSLLAKLIVWGNTREEAIARGYRALDEFIIMGLATTIDFHLEVVNNAFFRKGEIYTNFLARRIVNA